MTGIVAVHLGAGTHKNRYRRRYNKLARKASKVGVDTLKNGGSALDAVKAAIIVLENNPLTNAGFGSNLTLEGHVENDAAIMDGKTLLYGGCGAVPKVKNPIELACDLCLAQRHELPLGLIPPSLLVSNGAVEYARKAGLKVLRNGALVSAKALRQHRKYKRMLEFYQNVKYEILDTVGAVCVDGEGHVAAAASSGGLLLKKPGRVGQAALYASGVWADSFSLKTEPRVAVCTTGCGEHLVQTQLAKEIGDGLKRGSFPTTALSSTMTEKFLKSRFLENVEEKMGGALAIHVSQNGEGSLLWGHTTESISVGYMKTTDVRPTGLICEFPASSAVGSAVNVGGIDFMLNTDK